MKKGIQFLLMALAFALVFNVNNNAFALFGKDKSEAEKQEEVKQEKAAITSEQRYLLSEVAPVKAFFLIRKTIKKFS
jgi:uncharacterized membrane protein YsdA (DUF1294 family)